MQCGCGSYVANVMAAANEISHRNAMAAGVAWLASQYSAWQWRNGMWRNGCPAIWPVSMSALYSSENAMTNIISIVEKMVISAQLLCVAFSALNI